MSKLVLCDFDGVLSTYESGWKGLTNIPDPPVQGALEFIRNCFELGYDFGIYSMRTANDDYLDDAGYGDYHFSPDRYRGIEAVKSWLLHWGLEEDLVDRIKFPFGKPHFIVYIDDLAVRYGGGDFPDLTNPSLFTSWVKNNENLRTQRLVRYADKIKIKDSND